MQDLSYRGSVLGAAAAVLLSACAVTPLQGGDPPKATTSPTPAVSDDDLAWSWPPRNARYWMRGLVYEAM